MSMREPESFSPDVAQKLKTYVYRLIDPRNGETFYMGKGKGNRVFAHIRGEEGLEGDEIDNKLKRIRQIRLAGFEVVHVVHRHGMDDATAFEVEAALIDAYPGLTNIVGGTGDTEYGAMHAQEITRRYSAEPAVFRHKALLINVNRSAAERSLYDGTRGRSTRGRRRRQRSSSPPCKVSSSMHSSHTIGWRATAANFPGCAEGDAVPGRFGFVGEEASKYMKRLYVAKRVPDEYRRPGAANPIKYTWTG